MSVLEPEEWRPSVFGKRGRVIDRFLDGRRGGDDGGGADETRIFLMFPCRT